MKTISGIIKFEEMYFMCTILDIVRSCGMQAWFVG
jgi:hypothetical protein